MDAPEHPPKNEPHRIVTGKLNRDGSIEMREQGVERDKPKPDGTPGPVNVKKTKATGRKMLNGESGRKITHPRKRKTPEELEEIREQQTLKLLAASKVDDMGIFVNLLEKSGLCRNKAQRSVNTLEEAIAEARLRLEEDELAAPLNAHFGLDKQSGEAGKDCADGCTIASLLLMNAAMLHQRIAAGAWLPGIVGLGAIKVAPNAAQLALRHWNTITRHDFRPVLEPAIEVIWKVQDTGRESRVEQGDEAHRRRSGAPCGGLFGPRCRLRGRIVQQGHGQPGVRRRLFHAPGGRFAAGPACARYGGSRCGLDRSQNMGE